MDTAAYLVPGIRKWLLGLPAILRLYTSVIPRNPEKWHYKESWSTDLSPTTILLSRTDPLTSSVDGAGGEGVYPGWWDEGWLGGVLYRVLPAYPPGTHISVIFSLKVLPTAK